MGKLLGLFLVAAGFGLAIEMMPQGIYERGYSYVSRAVGPTAASSSRVQAGHGTAETAQKPRIFASTHPLAAPVESVSVSAQAVTNSIPVETSQASPATDTVHLARLLQAELRRVGCYSGDVDGDWGPASRRAMTAFARRVNSTLPIETPDLVLLSLVRGHNRRICAADCDDGQIMSSRGHCVRAPAVIEASAKPAGSWEPVITAGSRPQQAATRVASRQDSLGQHRTQVAAATTGVATPAPTTVTVSVNTAVPGHQAAPLPRTIDWTTRMGVGVVATPAAAAVPPSPVLGGVAPLQPAIASTELSAPEQTPMAPEAATPTRAAKPPVSGNRKVKRAKVVTIERPAPVYRPRSASNWRSTAFTARN